MDAATSRKATVPGRLQSKEAPERRGRERFLRAGFAFCALGFVFLPLATPAHAQTRDCASESGLRSATTGASVELSFRNASAERKRLYWIDYDGDRKFYTVVEPGNVYRQQTSSGHAWVVADDAEKCQTLVIAPDASVTVDIGGTAAAQSAPPAPGVQQPIAQAPVMLQPVQQAPVIQTIPQPQAVEPVQQQTVVSSPVGQPQQAMAADPLPQISPIEQFQLNGPYRVAARAEAGKFLNAQGSGGVEVARVKPEWDSTQWVFEAVPGTPFVRIKSRWKNTYLTDVNGTLRATSATPDADEAHWTFEPVDGTNYIQFRNRETDRFLLSANNAAALADDYRQDQETQTHWQVDSSTRAAPAASAPPRTAAYVAYDSALMNCRQIGGYWTGSSCRSPQVTVRLSCPAGWVWAPDIGECLWDDGGRCPPWQMSPNGMCVSDLACRGGRVRISGRGYPVCDCPIGTVTWGNYPNLSCVPSVARVLPLILGPGIQPGFQGRPKVGQGFGNKTFGQGVFGQGGGRPQVGGVTPVNVNPNRPGGTPPQTTPVVTTPNVTTPVVTTPATCPAGSTGTPPNCTQVVTTTPAVCPAGTTGTPPNCRTTTTAPNAPCAPWQTGVPGACVDKKVVCVGGTVEQGYCRCSQGFVPSGFNDNFTCQPRSTAACPAGSTGTPPNCKPTTATTPSACPTGTTGTPPNCRTATTAPNAPCAPWQTGVPGACVDKKVVCVGGTVEQGYCRCSQGFVPSGFNDNFTCQPRSTAACPAGSTGTPPNCKPTTATTPATCPAGQTGTPPNCVTTAAVTPPVGGPPLCTAGQNTASGCRCAAPLTVLPGGKCDRPTVAGSPCLEGQNVAQTQCRCVAPLKMIENGVCGRLALNETKPVAKQGNCAEGQDIKATNCMCLLKTVDMGGGRFVCSANASPQRTGGAGAPPQTAPTCPTGFTGTPPNCKPPVAAACPAGMTGTPPNCKPPVAAACPQGMTGTPPNCRPPVAAACPQGMTGTPPNCRAPVAAVCPPGFVGTPPICAKPNPTPAPVAGCAAPKKVNAAGQCI